MALAYTCDGCGCNVAAPKQIGYVIPRDYCEPCAVKAQDFIDAVELLQQTAQAQFVSARKAFIETASASNFKLPDVP